MIQSRIKKIFIDKRIQDHDITKRIMLKGAQIPYEVIDSALFYNRVKELSLFKGKCYLWITIQKGEMVKKCPATEYPYLCCQYRVINQITQCPMNCTYCILQGYLSLPVISLYVNLKDVFQSINVLLQSQPDRFFRFGTGELGDSLALDELTELSSDYIQFFKDKKNCIIEFKTKTNFITHLLKFPLRNAMVSWSLNPQNIIDEEETGTAGLEERLLAAKECQEAGFMLGFHFDPVLYFDGWEKLYYGVIQRMFEVVDGSRIGWISIGSLRYPPKVKAIIEERFPATKIIYEEMIRGLDGKERYTRPIRIELYKKIVGWLREKYSDLFIYFCMESPDVWDRVMGFHPKSNNELDYFFANSIFNRFPELGISKPDRDNYLS